MSSAPQILIIGINYAPERTGIGRYTGDMGAWLSGRGADVQVVTGFPYYPDWKKRAGYRTWWFQREVLEGVKLIRCPFYVPSHPTSFKRMIQDLTFLITSVVALTRLRFRGDEFQHIWVASPSFLSGWAGLLAGRLFPKAKRHLHLFDLPVDAARALGMIRNRNVIRILSSYESSMMKGYHRLSTLSKGMQELIIQKGVERQHVDLLPIWVDTHRFHPAHANLQLLRRFGIADDRRVILYSGAVGEKQGLESLLHMAGMAQSSAMTELLFVIAGEGPYVQTLKIQAQRLGLSNVMFIPLLSDEDFPEMLNCAWLHLVLQRDTSGEYFMPSKLYTILSVGGLAMVTADPKSSLGRLVSDHQIAALVPANDPSLLFQRMLDMLETPESNLTLKANARDFANHHLSRDSVLQKYWGHLLNDTNN